MQGTNYRQERIERLLQELRYEVTRGMMEGEIDETLGFEFLVPISKSIPDGLVCCSFRTRPVMKYDYPWPDAEPRLKIVK